MQMICIKRMQLQFCFFCYSHICIFIRLSSLTLQPYTAYIFLTIHLTATFCFLFCNHLLLSKVVNNCAKKLKLSKVSSIMQLLQHNANKHKTTIRNVFIITWNGNFQNVLVSIDCQEFSIYICEPSKLEQNLETISYRFSCFFYYQISAILKKQNSISEKIEKKIVHQNSS